MGELSTSRTAARAKIVDVAARLLRESGPEAITTRGVAEAAGVQAPAIYRLFGDKDGLLDAVAEHVMVTYVLTKAAVVEAAAEDDIDPLDDLHAGWETQIEFGVANPALFRLLSDPDRVVESPAARAGMEVLVQRVRRIAQTGRLQVSEQRAVNLIQAAGIGVIQTLLATPDRHRDPGLGEAMYEAVLGQIVTDAPGRIDDGPMATAVAFRAIAPQLTLITEAEQRLLCEWLDRELGGLQESTDLSRRTRAVAD